MPIWLENVFQLQNILLNVGGTIVGIIIGAMPGLNATVAISLLLPVTFHMGMVQSLIMLIAIYVGSMFGGSIAAILFRTPGTPGATATVIDGYPLCSKGRGRLAIGVAVLASTIGGTMSVLILMAAAPQIARFALTISAPDYFALALLGLTLVFSISGKSLIKGCISTTLGLLFGAVGMDMMTPSARLTFGNIEMLIGTPLVPAVAGLFAISQVFNMVLSEKQGVSIPVQQGPILPSLAEFRRIFKHILKSGLIGTFVGALPGTGAQVAAFLAYNEAKRSSKNKEKFGDGAIEGVAAPESANNGVTGGALIPMLTLGIPGDAVTAVMMGALIIQGLQPGPMLFRDFHAEMNTIFVSALFANMIMLVVGLGCAGYIAKLAMIDRKILGPIIAVIALLGAFAIRTSLFDVKIAFFFGLLGFFMERFKFPLAPLAIGLILGPIAERSFRQALIMSKGSFLIFFSKPVSAVVLTLAIIAIVSSIVVRVKGSLKNEAL